MIIKTWEMSGMGRGYEDGVQIMVWTAVKWLKGKGKDIFNGTKTYENVYGICETPKQLDELHDLMCKVNEGCSGDQYQCAIGHARFIHENGYDIWYKKMKDARKPEEEYDFDLDKMQLLPYMTKAEMWNKPVIKTDFSHASE